VSRKAKTVEITVVTPSLPDRTHLLGEAIQSVVAQTLPARRHLIAIDQHHVGPARLLNQMIDAAETEWVSILADDDLYDPDHLETLAAKADDGSIIMSWCRIEGRPDDQYRGEFDPRMLLARHDTGMRGCFMFKKNVWRMLDGFHDGHIQDWDFLARAVQMGIRFAPVYRETWTYRFHGGNVSDVIGALARGETPGELYHLKHL
jgi:glycosyltransferase involved in cell wall biosynthesis